MKDYKKEIAAYLDEVKGREKYKIDQVLEDIGRAKHVCVFGMGAISYPIVAALRNFTNIRIDLLSDNDQAKWGKIYHCDLLCVPPGEIAKYGNDVAVLITTQHYAEIYGQLKKMGLTRIFVVTEYRLLNNEYFKNKQNIEAIKRNALNVMDLLEDETSKEIFSVLITNWFDFDITGIGYKGIFSNDQYYPAGVIRLSDDESLVDAGAYNGDTLLDFIKRTNGKFSSIYAFELDRENFKEMEIAVNKLESDLREKIKLYNFGVLDEEKEIGYETGGSGKQSTCINMIGSVNESGKTVRLSDILKDTRVTFIKMDIESSEPKALLGAEEIIKSQKPKLAVCVYHKPEHLWEVPLYLKRIVPEYRIFLRHHTVLEYETVCYAVL